MEPSYHSFPEFRNTHQFATSCTAISRRFLCKHPVIAIELKQPFILEEIAFDLTIDSRTVAIDLARNLGDCYLPMQKIPRSCAVRLDLVRFVS